MKVLLFAAGVLGFAGLLNGQTDDLSARYASTITQVDLRRHLEVLASDSFLGRDTGKQGQKMAAAYLKEQFSSYGIPALEHSLIVDGYYQPYDLIEERNGSISVSIGNDMLRFPEEVVYLNETFRGAVEIENLTLLSRLNGGTFGKHTRPKHALVLVDSGIVLNRMRAILDQAGANSAELVFVVVPDELFGALRGFVHAEGSRMRLADQEGLSDGASARLVPQYLFVPTSSLGRIIGPRSMKRLSRSNGGKRFRTAIRVEGADRVTKVTAENVLAYIEGEDKKDEVVVITAHYDHIGVENGVVYNGADDDGSGTAALLEIAQAFSKAKASGNGPRRSILVMPVSGEEKGLLGSRHYSENPVFPLAETVANLNIDMIGRTDSAHAISEPYVYIIGSDRLSSELHAVNEEANNAHVGLDLDYRFNSEEDPNRFYYRSDHYNFARKGIPCIFYFSGVHEDYHQPGDDVDKIRFDLLEQRARLVFHTAWQLANREDRIKVDKPSK
jgi:hypothetical protein